MITFVELKLNYFMKTHFIVISINGLQCKIFPDNKVYMNYLKKFGVMHFIYYINTLITTKVESTYLGIQWHRDH